MIPHATGEQLEEYNKASVRCMLERRKACTTNIDTNRSKITKTVRRTRGGRRRTHEKKKCDRAKKNRETKNKKPN